MSVGDYQEIFSHSEGRSAQVVQIEQGKSLSVVALVMSFGALMATIVLAINMTGKNDDLRALIQAEAKSASATAVVRANDANTDVRMMRNALEERGYLKPAEAVK